MLFPCPECQQQISDSALACPHCGFPLKPTPVPAAPSLRTYGYEYKSKHTLFGLPLLHITKGFDPITGKKHVSKGIIAIGDIAIGGLALGGISCGLFAFGGIALGLFSFGGCSLGLLLAVGGLAIGSIAIGGLAIGGLAIGLAGLGGLALVFHNFLTDLLRGLNH